MQKKYIQPGEKVALRLTAPERMLVLECVNFLDDNCLLVIAGTPVSKPVMMTLDEIDDLSGYIAAEANHCDDKKKQKKLDAVFDKALKLLDRYTEEEPAPQSLSITEAQNKISQAMNSLMAGQNPGPVSFQLRPEELTQSGLIKLTQSEQWLIPTIGGLPWITSSRHPREIWLWDSRPRSRRPCCRRIRRRRGRCLFCLRPARRARRSLR